jgi:hypothetical protein
MENQDKNETIDKVVTYIINTLRAKALYSIGGWKEVDKHISDSDCFNHNFSISETAIYSKLKENNDPINVSILRNMKMIAERVNHKLGIKAVEYYVNRKNHTIIIID